MARYKAGKVARYHERLRVFLYVLIVNFERLYVDDDVLCVVAGTEVRLTSYFACSIGPRGLIML
jgi:hypothetical protein